MFQQVGGSAYKEGLENTRILDEHFGHPHRSFRTIHLAGTNGKGSCSHTLAAILQEAGYRVGLYTSPHLVDFRERIRINGSPIPEEYVVHFVEKERDFFEPLHPSFFELTTANTTGAFSAAAFCRKTGLVSGVVSPMTTGMPGLMIPAFSPAIFAYVSPKNWVWSKLMLVMMHKSG